jgi:hypothetical protein
MFLRVSRRPNSPQRSQGGARAASSQAQPARPPLGNQALQHLLRSGAVQAKLTVNQPGDRYEQEADRVAEEVVQRKCACGGGGEECAECGNKEEIQRSPASPVTPPTAPRQVERVLGSSGRPLDAAVRADLEPRFGRDFSRMRVHDDERAAESAREIHARAYTAGDRIVFGSGQYAPESPEGKKLLAHELTHVLQQSRDGEPWLQRNETDDELEEPEKLAEEGKEGNDDEEGEESEEGLAAGGSLFGFPGAGQKAKGKGAGKKPGGKGGSPQGGAKGTSATPAACPNQAQVNSIIAKNPRGYSAKVKMYTHAIANGETLSGLAGSTRKDNTVKDSADLSKELVALNKGIKKGTVGNCVVLIKGWESPAWQAEQKRVNCDERIATFKKDKTYAVYSTWERETVAKSDKGYEMVVERVAKRNSKLFEGRKAEYAKLVETLNDSWIGSLNEGECVALPVGWKDPNIGQLPAKPAAGPITGKIAEGIATVYAEQTLTTPSAKEQQKYIWFSMRKRIETADFGPDFDSILTKQAYNAYGNTDYKAAVKDLALKTPSKTGVANAKQIALDNWTNSRPSDAGAFYFHWRTESQFKDLENCYGAPEEKDREAKEKECAWNFANKHGFSGSVAKASGWSHRIPGDTPAPDQRLLSMYIYP